MDNVLITLFRSRHHGRLPEPYQKILTRNYLYLFAILNESFSSKSLPGLLSLISSFSVISNYKTVRLPSDSLLGNTSSNLNLIKSLFSFVEKKSSGDYDMPSFNIVFDGNPSLLETIVISIIVIFVLKIKIVPN